ncbi:hypothetical protein Ancab_035854 [Ancistrocladus abbreviatus]
MVNASEIRTAVGIVGNVISIGLLLSPIPTFVRIIKAKSVQHFKPDPYLATILNCALWVFYGMPFVHPDSLLVITINGAGLVIETIYNLIFFIYSSSLQRKKIVLTLLVEFIFFAGVVLITLKVFHDIKPRTIFVGALCVAFNIIMYASPLTVMVPNGLGALSGVVQLILYAVYYKTTNWDESDTKEVELPAEA